MPFCRSRGLVGWWEQDGWLPLHFGAATQGSEGVVRALLDAWHEAAKREDLAVGSAARQLRDKLESKAADEELLALIKRSGIRVANGAYKGFCEAVREGPCLRIYTDRLAPPQKW